MCSNNERRDDFWRDIYKKIQLNSKETKYKRIHKRNKLLSLKIGEFVSTISLSKRYKKLVKRKEELTVYTNSNNFFQNHSVSEFLAVLLNKTQGQNIFELREFSILKEKEITQQDKELFEVIYSIHDKGVRGRKKKMFKTNRYLH